MENNTDVRAFLTGRRERLTPEQVGIIGGGRRRVPGLRREEVAMLAGVSADYYVRMERGNLSGVSLEVLDAVASALRLSDAESEHLHDLARTANTGPVRRRKTPSPGVLRPSIQRMLDAMTTAPAAVTNPRQDILATNDLGRALFAPILEDSTLQGNAARFIFYSPSARLFYPDWEAAADNTVAAMRTAAGHDPHDKPLTDIVGELVTRSDHFRQRWASHEVRHHQTGAKQIVHPRVGDLDVIFERLDLPGTPGWAMFVYTAEAGSPTAERMLLLGSLAATEARTGPAPAPRPGPG